MAEKFAYPDKLLARFDGSFRDRYLRNTHHLLPKAETRVRIDLDQLVTTFVFVELEAVKSTGVFRKYRTTGRSLSVYYEVRETSYPADIEIKFRVKHLQDLLTESRAHGSLRPNRWSPDEPITVTSDGRSIPGLFMAPVEGLPDRPPRETSSDFEVFEESEPTSRYARLKDPEHLALWRSMMMKVKVGETRLILPLMAELAANLATDEEMAAELDVKELSALLKQLDENLKDPNDEIFKRLANSPLNRQLNSCMSKLKTHVGRLTSSTFPV
jgi:hypothetical protein